MFYSTDTDVMGCNYKWEECSRSVLQRDWIFLGLDFWLVAQHDTIARDPWKAAMNAATWGFSQQPAASRSSISLILISKLLITRGGNSTRECG